MLTTLKSGWCQCGIQYWFKSSQSIDKQAIMFPPTWLFYVWNRGHLENHHILIIIFKCWHSQNTQNYMSDVIWQDFCKRISYLAIWKPNSANLHLFLIVNNLLFIISQCWINVFYYSTGNSITMNIHSVIISHWPIRLLNIY